MAKRHPSYEFLKAHCPSEKFPIGTVLVRYWEHMEEVHGATPEDYGMNVRKWHERNHPDCTTMPTFEEARKIPQPERQTT